MDVVDTVDAVDLTGMKITKHAADQFSRRLAVQAGEVLENREAAKTYLRAHFLGNLSKVGEEEAKSLRYWRRDGKFFRCGPWVFVVADDSLTLITVFWKEEGKEQ